MRTIVYCLIPEYYTIKEKKIVLKNIKNYILPKHNKDIFFSKSINFIQLILRNSFINDKDILQYLFIDGRLTFFKKEHELITTKSKPITVYKYYSENKNYDKLILHKMKHNLNSKLYLSHLICVNRSYISEFKSNIFKSFSKIKKLHINVESELLIEETIHDFLYMNHQKIKCLEKYIFFNGDRDIFTMDTFGKMGRLGNQIFQYTFLINLCKKYNRILKLPYNRSMYDKKSIAIDKLFNLKLIYLDSIDYMKRLLTYKETKFNYNDEIELINYKRKVNYNFYGYFQSEKYFIDIKFDIFNYLRYNIEIQNKVFSELHKIQKDTLVSIHVRRGDLVEAKQYGPPITINYLQEAVNYMRKNINYKITWVIFSDDIEWCKNKLKLKENIVYPNGNKYEDFIFMSKCDHHIISNSTFSWWASYLNNQKNKIVIYPDKWFYNGFLNNGENKNDLILKEWKCL